MAIKYGCHGSTWELDYDKESDYFPEIAEVVEYAGFQGVDIQVSLLGRFKENPSALKKELDPRSHTYFHFKKAIYLIKMPL